MKQLSYLLIVLSCHLFAQEDVREIRFVPTLEHAPLQMEQWYVLNGDSIRVDACRFYLSDLRLVDGTESYAADKPAVLVDAATVSAVSFHVPASLHEPQLQFTFGIDSTTSVSGAMPDDLDPVNGMYWTWQSGYINLKIEGVSPASPARHHEFQYHLGGYAFPYSTAFSVIVPLGERSTVFLPLDDFFAATALRTQHHIMRPCKEAVVMSKLLAGQFRLHP